MKAKKLTGLKARRRKGSRIGNEPVGYLFILPFYLFFFFLIVLPILIGIFNSFTDYNLYNQRNFVGLANYRQLFTDPLLRQAVLNTLYYSLLYIIPSLVLGLTMSMLLTRENRATKVFRTGFYLPYIISTVCASTIWLWLFEPSGGFLNQLRIMAGLPVSEWLKNPDIAMLCVVLVSLWKNLGYCMLIFLSGLKAIPAYLYEAAEIDGANGWQRFRHITIPMLQPTTFFLFITSVISSFNVFEQVNVMTAGGPMNQTTTVVHQIYVRGFTEFKMGYASAISVMLMLVVFVVTAINFRFGNQGQDTEM